MRTLLLAIVICSVDTYGETQYQNLARTYRQSVKQSTTDGNSAEMAVNGNMSDCSRAKKPTSGMAWWWVGFQGEVNINKIVIHPKPVNKRGPSKSCQGDLNSINVSLSNSPDLCSGDYLPLKGDQPNKFSHVTIQVGKVGRYIYICKTQNVPEHIVLTEVKVFGCPYGRYGGGCNKKCGHCYNSTCNLSDGACPDKCDSGYMGLQCDKECPPNCKAGICDQEDGRCCGCANDAFWNLTCSAPCFNNCADGLCSQNGNCASGCVKGYWGKSCNATCPDNCLKCEKLTGSCVTCREKKWGPKCHKFCPDNCWDSVCHITTGACEKCMDGYRGHNCTEECEDGYFGIACSRKCGKCHGGNGQCLHTNGMCHLGCTESYSGDLCLQQKDKSTSALVVSGSVVVAFCLVIILGGGIVFCLSKTLNRNRPSTNTSHRAEPTRTGGDCPLLRTGTTENVYVQNHTEQSEDV